jgi:hypothetical protein
MDFEVWKLARVYDALSSGCRPKPGDGVLLAQLTTQHLDDSLSRYAGRFLAKSLRDVAFVVGDFKHYLTSDATPSSALKSEVKLRYTGLGPTAYRRQVHILA